MATTTFSLLAVPSHDDTMEVSSPQRHVSDDIDIDFEDYHPDEHFGDDDYMQEDDEQTHPAATTDDLMDDDVPQSQQVGAIEEIMEDDPAESASRPQEDDEELIDYSEDEREQEQEHDVQISVDPPAFTEDSPIPPHQIPLTEDEVADEEITRGPGTVDTAQQSTDIVAFENNSNDVTPYQPEVVTGDEHLPSQAANAQSATVEAAPLDQEESVTADLQASTTTDHEQYQFPEQEQPLTKLHPATLDTYLSPQDEGSHTPTDTGLHPMYIRYGDMTMSLFRSKRQPEGLLKDDNLASLSLAELIQHCRQRLALRVGVDLSEDQELILSFDHLGLVLVEDSRPAFETSLNDVLEVYLHLHENDGNDDIPPLSLSLSLQLKFRSSLRILEQAAAGGQGMTSFDFLRSASDGHDEIYGNEEFEYHPEEEQNAEDGTFENEEDELQDNQDEDRPAVEGNEGDPETAHQEEKDYHEDEHQAHYEQDSVQYDQNDQQALEDAFDEIFDHQGESSDWQDQHDTTLYNVFDEIPATAKDDASTEVSHVIDGDHNDDHHKVESTTSSTTIQGDILQDNDEDIVQPPQDNPASNSDNVAAVKSTLDETAAVVHEVGVDFSHNETMQLVTHAQSDYVSQPHATEDQSALEANISAELDDEDPGEELFENNPADNDEPQHLDQPNVDDFEDFDTSEHHSIAGPYEHEQEHESEGPEQLIDNSAAAAAAPEVSHVQPNQLQDYEEEFRFDDEFEDPPDLTFQDGTTANDSSTINSKRPFDDIDTADLYDDDEPVTKKNKAS